MVLIGCLTMAAGDDVIVANDVMPLDNDDVVVIEDVVLVGDVPAVVLT